MRKLWLILPFVLFTTLIFAFESDRWGRSAVTSASVTDSCSQVRSEIDDSIVVFADTMEANPVLINDLKVIDSMRVPLWISAPATGAVGMLGVDSAQDSLFVYFPGGKTAIYPQVSAGVMTGGDIQDSLNNATRSITQTWEWDGGNIIAADGQQIIATDDAEDDSLQAYIATDTAFIVATGIPISIGEAGLTTIGDTLGLPLWNDAPATATIGACALDTNGTDTAWIYTQDGWKSFVPAAAGGSSIITTDHMTADSALTTSTLTNSPLSFAVTSGTYYHFAFYPIFSNTGGSGTGVKVSVTCPAVTKFSAIVLIGGHGGDGVDHSWGGDITSSGDAVTSTNWVSSGVYYQTVIEGTILPSENGTLMLQFATEDGAQTITMEQGSHAFLYTIP